jgi:cytochrome c biogenesis protein
MTFYQTDWQINALRIQIDSSCIIQYRLNKVQIGKSMFWICNLPIESNNYIFIIISNFNDDIYIYNNFGSLISVVSLDQKVNISNNNFRIKEIMSSTGLQIKVDPGLLLVYLGFTLLMFSTFISYISYSQLWFGVNNYSCYLSGSTNRAILYFEEELAILSNIYIQNSV